MRAVLTAIAQGRLDAEIVCVFCNRERGQSANTDAFLDDVESTGIPLITSSSLAWRRRVGGEISDPQGQLAPWRREFDRDALNRVRPHRPDLAMLAGYMLVVSSVLCEALPMLNLHPALPGGPIGAWQEVIRRLIADRAEESGMMIQRVTTELDRGAILSFCRYSIRGGAFDPLWQSDEGALFNAIRAAGVSRESCFIVETLNAVAGGAIDLEQPALPLDLTDVVESVIASD